MTGPTEESRGATERLGAIRGVSWVWRSGNSAGKSGADIGVIAQEVEAVFPSWWRLNPPASRRSTTPA